jgi:hypothetical protein
MGKQVSIQINFESPGYGKAYNLNESVNEMNHRQMCRLGTFANHHLPKGPMPLLWSEDRVVIGASDAASFRDGVSTADTLQTTMFVLAPLLCCCCCVLALAMFFVCRSKRRDDHVEMNPAYTDQRSNDVSAIPMVHAD